MGCGGSVGAGHEGRFQKEEKVLQHTFEPFAVVMNIQQDLFGRRDRFHVLHLVLLPLEFGLACGGR